jgi:hypothetical protein
MANWYGTCRSNYFRVKDEAAFLEWIADFEATVIRDDDDKVGFISNDEYGGVPRNWPDDDEEPISILEGIAEHLAENHVCVILEAGAEKARYVTGQAIAIAWTGERTEIQLGDIYAQAQEEFGGDAEITEAIY